MTDFERSDGATVEENTGSLSNEISAQNVRIADTIAIKTLHNVYRLMITDPSRLYGMLVGGIVGDHPTAAALCTVPKLRVGLPARLLVNGGDGRCRLIKTSAIMSLRHIKGG